MSKRRLLVDVWVCFVLLSFLSAAHADIFAISPIEGTVGTQLTLSGSGFGGKQGAVLVGDERCKVLDWDNTRIVCLITKPQPPRIYTVTVSVQGNKKRSEPMTFSYFAMRGPRIIPPDPPSLALEGDTVILNGAFFGDKNGDVTLLESGRNIEKAKVVDWTMDTIRFELPRELTGVRILRVSNDEGLVGAV